MKKRNEAGGKHIANPAAKKLKEKKPEQIRPVRRFPEETEPELEQIFEEEEFREEFIPVPEPERIERISEPELPEEEPVPEKPAAQENLPEGPVFPETSSEPEEAEKPKAPEEEELPVPEETPAESLSVEDLPADEVIPATEVPSERAVPEEESSDIVQPVEDTSAEEKADESALSEKAAEQAGNDLAEEAEPEAAPSGKEKEKKAPPQKPKKSVKKVPSKKDEMPEPSIPAIIIGAVLAAALLFLCLLAIKFGILPVPLLIAGMAVLLGLAFICVTLVWTTRRPVRFSIGVFLSVVMIAALIIGCFALQRAWKTAQKITTVDKPTTVVGVYVKTDDTAASTADLKGYTFGIIREQDREDTDQALRLLATDLGTTIYVVEYDDVIKLIAALYNSEIQSAVFESYHIDLLTSMEAPEYAALAAQAREIGNYTVEKLSQGQSTYLGDIGESPIGKKEENGNESMADDGEDHLIAIYVSGIDSYGTVNVQSRSDVNVLVFVNTKTHQVLMVNTPRDYYVYTTVSGSYRDKLTHAGLWGPECSMGTLEYLYDCEVDYYFRVNFSGFVDIVTALGGLDIALADDQPVLHFTPEEALLLARDRHYFGGEFARGLRHMRIIKALINQILSTDLIYNYSDLLDAVDDSFITTVPYDLLADLVKDQIRYNPTWDIITYAVTGTGTSDVCYSFLTYNDPNGVTAYVSVPNYDTVQTAHDLIEAMSRDEIISEPEKNYKE